jgi:hypothetical protein
LRSIYEVRLKQFIVQNVLKIKTNISHGKTEMWVLSLPGWN